MTHIPVRQLSAELAHARSLIASAAASPELDSLVVADILGVAIELDDTYPPPPPLGEQAPGADPAADLRAGAVLLATEVDRSAAVADAVRTARPAGRHRRAAAAMTQAIDLRGAGRATVELLGLAVGKDAVATTPVDASERLVHRDRILDSLAGILHDAKIRAYIDGWNDRAHPFTWTKTARPHPHQGQP